VTWGQITDEGLAAAAELIGQPLRRSRMQWISTATRDAIRHFAWGIGDNNPLWADPDYAASAPAGSLLGPPCMLYAVDSTIVAPKLPGVQWIYAGTEWTWYDHVRADDSFTVDAQMIDQKIKSGRRFARWALQSGEVRYTNQHGVLAASAVGHCARTPRGDALKSEKGAAAETGPAPRRYSPEELAAIDDQVLAERSRGAEPLYWEDVAIGDEPPAIARGPLSTIDVLAWYSGTQGALHYGGAHGDMLRYRRRHDDYQINDKTGAKDSPGRGHMEGDTGRDVGMGGAYDIGPQRISWAQTMLCNWIGDHGFLHQLKVSVRQPNLVGSTLWWHGTVTGKSGGPGARLVELDVKAVNQDDVTSAFGTAVVALPSRVDGPVVLPLAVDG
jgi:acyl dehydratase